MHQIIQIFDGFSYAEKSVKIGPICQFLECKRPEQWLNKSIIGELWIFYLSHSKSNQKNTFILNPC